MNQEEMGKVLKELRKRKGYTQQEIASSLVITPQTISKWENGLSYPSLDMLVALSKLYDVSVDELVSGDIENDISVIKEDSTAIFTIMSYVLLLILLGLGIATLFVPYERTVHYFRIISADTYYYFTNPYYSVLEQPGWVILSMMIITPIILTFTSVLDRGKRLTFILSFISLSILSFELSKMMGHYEYYEPHIGMIFHMVYLVILIGIGILFVLTSTTNLQDTLLESKKNLLIGLTVFLIAFILPFTYTEVFYQNDFGWNVNYYFNPMDQGLTLLLYGMSGILLFGSDKTVIKWSAIVKILLIIAMLCATVVYIFNDGLYITSVLLYTVVILLGISFEKGFLQGLKIGSIKNIILTILEVLSILSVLYLITLTGDIFFGDDPYTGFSESIRYNDLGYGSLYAVSFIFIIVSMFLRFIRQEQASYIVYGVWFIGQIYVMIDLLLRFILNGYHVSDGLFFFVPPVLIGGYFLTLIGMHLRKKANKKCE